MTAAFPPSFANDAVTDLVRAYLEPVATPLKARVGLGDQGARRALTELLDVGRCLRYLGWVVSRGAGVGSQAAALTLLGQLCREDAEADVLLASVHRAKGKEWPRVTVLYPELMPLGQGDPVEERAVQFVAVTRAQRVLRFAYGKDAWAAQQLVSPGTLPAPDAALDALVVPEPVEIRPSVTPERVKPRFPALQAPADPGCRSMLPALPVGGPAVARVEDPRAAWPLIGGDMPIPVELLRVRLTALAGESRFLLQAWAKEGLRLLGEVAASFVGVHEVHLSMFERAAKLARRPLPAFGGVGVSVCVFEGGVSRVRRARPVRWTNGVVWVQLGEEEVAFDRMGERVEGAGPLSPFILAAELTGEVAS